MSKKGVSKGIDSRLKPALVVLSLCIVSCASMNSHQGKVEIREEILQDSSSQEDRAVQALATETYEEDEIALLIAEAQSYLRAGETAIDEGRISEASEAFDRAVEVILQSGYDLEAEPSLEAGLRQILEGVEKHRTVLQSWTSLSAEEEHEASLFEPAVIDTIAEVEDIPSPDAAVQEAETAEPARLVEEPRVWGDIPLEVNKTVEAFIELYQTDLRDEFVEGLIRSGQYLPMIHGIFREKGVPLDLAFLALVESNFKPRAYSRARACGMWQFIRSTGRLYGLKSDWWMDERYDPEKATRAAAQHLKDLYAAFGDWYLAMAAYNSGSGKVSRAIRKVKSKDFWRLARTRYLRRETRHYVPAYIAATMIAANPESYGFHIEPDPPLEYEKTAIHGWADFDVIAECSGIEVKEIRALNPELKRLCVPDVKGGYQLKLPPGKASVFQEKFAAIPASKRIKFYTHKVRKGETVSQLAAKYRTSVVAICSMNNIRNVRRVQVGTILMIPSNPYYRAKSSKQADRQPASHSGYAKGQKITYKVRRGDTIAQISKRFRTTIGSIIELNNLRSAHLIYPGQKLTVVYGRKGSSSGHQGRELVYRVKRGDSLYRIARKYKTSVANLMIWNNLDKSDLIHPGQKLTIKVE